MKGTRPSYKRGTLLNRFLKLVPNPLLVSSVIKTHSRPCYSGTLILKQYQGTGNFSSFYRGLVFHAYFDKKVEEVRS